MTTSNQEDLFHCVTKRVIYDVRGIITTAKSSSLNKHGCSSLDQEKGFEGGSRSSTSTLPQGSTLEGGSSFLNDEPDGLWFRFTISIFHLCYTVMYTVFLGLMLP